MPSHAGLKTIILYVSVDFITFYSRREYIADGQSDITAMTSVAAAPMTAKVTDCS